MIASESHDAQSHTSSETLRGSIRSSRLSHRISGECALHRPSATMRSAPSPHEDRSRPPAAQKQEGFSRAPKPAHQLVVRDWLALAGPVSGQTLIQNFLVARRHWHLFFIGNRQPQALSDFKPLPLWQPKERRNGFGWHAKKPRRGWRLRKPELFAERQR